MMNNPIDCQRVCLENLLKKAAKTVWGTQYDYASIKNLETFKSRVPVSDYQSLYPFIERMISGEKNVLWQGVTDWFSKSSGTSGSKSKFIPVSSESLSDNNYKSGRDSFTLYFNNRPDSKLFTGKYFSLTGTLHRFETNTQARCGDVSAILTNFTPFWANYFKTPTKNIALMKNWDEKIDAFAQCMKNQRVTGMAGVLSWILIILKRILELEQADTFEKIWSDLELFMHGGVNFTPYVEQYKALIPSDKMYYQEIYNASEGYFAAQDKSDSKEMLLFLNNGIFYEFIPFHEFGNENPRTLSIEEVKLNEKYVMLISTNAGLWRYVVGDVVQFTSVRPYRIVIIGRTTHYINAFGEELMVDNAEKAIKAACTQTSAEVEEYTVAPVYFQSNTKAAHQWLIEFKQKPNNFDKFIEILDTSLKQLNSDYEAKRFQDILLQKPVVEEVASGTFIKWMASQGKLGGQFKVPRLSNNRNIVESITKMG
ncbi:MAG: GH3 auxin-responsive promoter family protein [Lentimicrobiaceae bacterium]|nr:GH3 auxin-responsive promoter family protein [Lentimicrobiaceae bacterium]